MHQTRVFEPLRNMAKPLPAINALVLASNTTVASDAASWPQDVADAFEECSRHDTPLLCMVVRSTCPHCQQALKNLSDVVAEVDATNAVKPDAVVIIAEGESALEVLSRHLRMPVSAAAVPMRITVRASGGADVRFGVPPCMRTALRGVSA